MVDLGKPDHQDIDEKNQPWIIGILIDEGGPGMTSSITLLFADDPKGCVAEALKALALDLA